MKTILGSYFAVFVLESYVAYGQGAFVYDQQSNTNELAPGSGGLVQDIATPFGQSFTPALPLVGFIRLDVSDAAPMDGGGATMYVNLRADSITGTVLASSEPVFLPDGYAGFPNFLFSNPVAVTPGTTYYFEPLGQYDSPWRLYGAEFFYSGGTAIVGGLPYPSSDLWFREGVVVPEPGAVSLWLLGGGILVLWKRRLKT
jgi:hypothetical protein